MAIKKYEAILEWAKLKESNRDIKSTDKRVQMALDKTQGKYSLDMIVTDEVRQQMVADGIPEVVLGNQMFKDIGEGMWRYKAKREHFNPNFTDKCTGEKGVVLGAPPVYDYHASKDAGERIPLEGLIGNGSKGIVALEVSELQNGSMVVRISFVAVKELVEYEGDVF